DALAAIQATPASSCDDGDACTADSCEAGHCVFTPLQGIDGLTCLCAQGLTPADCAQLPHSVASPVHRVCQLVDRTAGSGARRARRLAKRLVVTVARATHAAAAAEARGAIEQACGAALGARLADTRARAVALRDTP